MKMLDIKIYKFNSFTFKSKIFTIIIEYIELNAKQVKC